MKVNEQEGILFYQSDNLTRNRRVIPDKTYPYLIETGEKTEFMIDVSTEEGKLMLKKILDKKPISVTDNKF